MISSVRSLPVNKDLITGIDVGGTKVHIDDSVSTNVLRYSTDDFPDLPSLLEDYFIKVGAKPTSLVIAMAGPRDDVTGEVKLTNHPWPTFYPFEATKEYGINCSTVNDMVATAAGVLSDTGIDMQELKAGNTVPTGNKLIISLSTGVGVAATVWDKYSNRSVIIATEGGHIGIQPKSADETDYLNFLHKKYPHPSAELALSGKFGLENLIDWALYEAEAPLLANSITVARNENTPVGAVLFEYSSHGKGKDKMIANKILKQHGTMLGSVIRDLSVAYKATGGVYLTGSVALSLGEYFITHTEFIERYIREGAVHDRWIKDIPINLVTNPNIAVMGALSLAKEEATKS